MLNTTPLTKRERVVLGYLVESVDRETDQGFVDASRVSGIEWLHTEPVDRYLLSGANGVGRTLSSLHRKGMASRRWQSFGAVWEYRPTVVGRREIA